MANRIEKIVVKNLFGQFNHVINLDSDQDIHVLTGPNGCGKTTILKLLDFIFDPSLEKYQEIQKVSFEEFKCFFSNGRVIGLKKEISEEFPLGVPYYHYIKRENGEKESKVIAVPYAFDDLFEKTDLDEEGFPYKIMFKNEITLFAAGENSDGYEETIPIHLLKDSTLCALDGRDYKEAIVIPLSAQGVAFLPFFNDSLYEDIVIDDDSTLDEYKSEEESSKIWMEHFEKLKKNKKRPYRHANKENALDAFRLTIINFVKKYDCDIDIGFIRADRISDKNTIFEIGDRELETDIDNTKVIEAIVDDFTKKFKECEAKYNRLIYLKKDDLPREVVEANVRPTFEEFADECVDYFSRLKELRDVFLIDRQRTFLEEVFLEKQDDFRETYHDNSKFLSTYLRVFKDTLAPWDDVYSELKLFIDIINSRNAITKKELRFTSSKGFYMVDNKLDTIELNDLSSGEKNDFIMFYNLIFRTNENSLVLIDEPEISLHIVWQEEFLDRLLEICKMNGMNAIVATHSPHIVNGHFDLYADWEIDDEEDK